MRFRRLRIFATLMALPTALPGCLALDREEEVRAQIRDWVFLAQTRSFTSRTTCTAAIFDTLSGELRSTARIRRVSDLRTGLRGLEEGQTVAFEMPGMTPNGVSEALMSVSLSSGLGVVSSFVGPAQACMSDSFQRDIFLALMSQETVLVYDPTGDALLLLHRPSRIVFFLRGNV